MAGGEKKKVVRRHGMFRNVPRSLKTAVKKRLRDLESDDATFDRTAVEQRARLKRLYALLHVQPSDRAQASLFGTPPKGSPLYGLREVAGCTDDPVKAARLVREHHLPYLAVESALGAIPQMVAVALVETMPADELVARLPLLSRRGLLTGSVREAVLKRGAALRRDPPPGLTYNKIEAVIRSSKLDRDVAEALIALVRIPLREDILSGDTAVAIDASASMTRTGPVLELAAQIGHRLDTALDAEAALHVVAFGLEARRIAVPRRSDLGRWRTAVSLPASDVRTGTSAGAALRLLADESAQVGRLIVVTDGWENRPPRLASALAEYRDATGRTPRVHLVQPAGGARQLAMDLKSAHIPFSTFQADRHNLGLDAFVASLDVEPIAPFDAIREYPLA